MSSPAEPKRRRLDDDPTSSNGVSFVAQDVLENASSKLKTEPATGRDDAGLHARLEVALERQKVASNAVKEAQAALQSAKDEEKNARLQIRAKGEVEYDSLLFVGNDGLSAALAFLTLPELGRSERVCRAFRMLSLSLWASIERKLMLPNKSASEDAKTRLIRHHVASLHGDSSRMFLNIRIQTTYAKDALTSRLNC